MVRLQWTPVFLALQTIEFVPRRNSISAACEIREGGHRGRDGVFVCIHSRKANRVYSSK